MPEQKGEHCAGFWYFFEIPACLRTLAPQADPHTDIATNLLDERISQYKGVGRILQTTAEWAARCRAPVMRETVVSWEAIPEINKKALRRIVSPNW